SGPLRLAVLRFTWAASVAAVIIAAVTELREAVTLSGVLFGLATYGAFIVFLFVLTRLLPGKKVVGQPLPGSGQRLTYKVNGMALFVATHMLVFVGAWFFDLSLTPLLEQFWSLLIAANIITVMWLLLMYR